MRRRKLESGNYLLETAMFLPVLFLLLFGMIEIARITYTYYALQKVLLSVARNLGTQQGVNFCDDGDTIVQQAKQFAVTASADDQSDPIIRNLTVDQIQVRIERVTSDTGDVGQCDCDASNTGCDTANGAGAGPDFIVVSIPDGYPFQLSIPQVAVDPILLKPRVRMPYQGT